MNKDISQSLKELFKEDPDKAVDEQATAEEAEDFPPEETAVEPEPETEKPAYKNLWDDPDFPKTGWECIGMTDLGETRAVCQLCGQQNVRYAHRMRHPQYGELVVGCTCAGKMEGDIERAKKRERDFKNNPAGFMVSEKPKIPYHERYYLHYRGGRRTTPQDLEGTQAFLKQLGFDGGELRQARTGECCAENYHNAERGKNNQMYCSYCGSEIAGVEYYRLPDGRLRCTACSSTLVQTKAEAQEICQRVIANMDNFFGATIDVPVNIEILDERKLKKKVGVPLGTKDSQSLLILGVAINKKNKYTILLENGAPRISMIATFAHELTHIWQYTHWDNRKGFKKCPKSKRLLIYEGMAKWAELQYLYLVGETNVARREENKTRKRNDEYGIGFCLYEDRYPLSREAMTCEDTPFTPDRYPFD